MDAEPWGRILAEGNSINVFSFRIHYLYYTWGDFSVVKQRCYSYLSYVGKRSEIRYVREGKVITSDVIRGRKNDHVTEFLLGT